MDKNIQNIGYIEERNNENARHYETKNIQSLLARKNILTLSGVVPLYVRETKVLTNEIWSVSKSHSW